MTRRFAPEILWLSVLLLSVFPLTQATPALGQEPQNGGLPLPADPAAWLNSRPITSEALKGKAAVLWFYEEGCPRCREKWPNLIAVSKKFEGQPVLFIAINSGTSRSDVEAYVRDVELPWPTIVDSSRELEKAAGVGEVSLRNIHQLGFISADGRFSRGDWSKMEETATRVVKDAKWLVDPKEIPAALQPAWNALEFGDLASAAPLIKKGLASKELKAGASKLNDAVQRQIGEQIELARKATESAGKWPTYKAYHEIALRFAGYSLPDEIEAKKRELAGDEQVKKELAAMQILDLAKRGFASNSTGARRAAISRLKKLIQDSPDTDAAQEAQGLLASGRR